MIYLVKKKDCHNMKTLVVFSASGHTSSVDEEEKNYLQEEYKVGTICLSNWNGYRQGTICLDERKERGQYEGTISVDALESKVTFDVTKLENDDGRQRRGRVGKYFGDSGQPHYIIEEKFQTRKTFWIFRSGYSYYTLKDVVNNRQYKIMDITFASDMHYYYVYDASEQLTAAIYKPYRNVGQDEYHIYAAKNNMREFLLFLVAYMDFFHYPYNSAMISDPHLESGHYKQYEDEAAYEISTKELLKLYDEGFVRRVILNEA